MSEPINAQALLSEEFRELNNQRREAIATALMPWVLNWLNDTDMVELKSAAQVACDAAETLMTELDKRARG